MAVRAAEIEAAIEDWAPLDTAMPNDPTGHQVGPRDRLVRRVGVSLDAYPTQVEAAHNLKCDMLVSHHPLIYRPLQLVDPSEPVGRSVSLLCTYKMVHYCAHTNWDAAKGGVNDALAQAIGLQDVQDFAFENKRSSIKIVTFVPQDGLTAVIDALAEAGAGRIGLYRRCAFFHLGTGTFEPLEGASPTVGTVGHTEEVEEIRLEMVAPAANESALVSALRAAHPYEEPAYDLVPLRSGPAIAMGRLGMLAEEITAEEFAYRVSVTLGTSVRTYGAQRRVRRVAIVAGSGSGFVRQAVQARADALLTGEVRHNHALEAESCGLALLDATHEGTEQPGVAALAVRLREHFGRRLDVLLMAPDGSIL